MITGLIAEIGKLFLIIGGLYLLYGTLKIIFTGKAPK